MMSERASTITGQVITAEKVVLAVYIVTDSIHFINLPEFAGACRMQLLPILKMGMQSIVIVHTAGYRFTQGYIFPWSR